jgi:hypothetical protein
MMVDFPAPDGAEKITTKLSCFNIGFFAILLRSECNFEKKIIKKKYFYVITQ